MKLSERFRLGATQFELDFVDINTDSDTPLFIDPYYLGVLDGHWVTEASRTLRNFFQTFVELVRAGDNARARSLFDNLHEPNETCLGLSRDRPRGNAIGEIDSAKLFDSVIESRAIESGVVEDLEDFRLFIPGIDKDKVSDMTTNIIRFHLIEYTQQQCELWEIPLLENVQSGFYWQAAQRQWVNGYTRMLVVNDRRILLTPKSIVSYCKKYTPKKYFGKFVLEFLQREHLASRSGLVQHRKNGTPYVTKKSLQESVAPYSKEFLATFTEAHPEVFRDFKDWVRHTAKPLANKDISDQNAEDVARYLIQRLRGLLAGTVNATIYHRVSVGILELLFYPDVVSPVVEQEIHDGRKRIDISFDNAASGGFFHRLHAIYQTPAQFIFVECKNYSREVANPELDQLAGRFSVNRGKFGLLLCRTVDDMATLIQRCADAYTDQRGIMLPVTDDDLEAMLGQVIAGERRPYERLLSDRFRAIALR